MRARPAHPSPSTARTPSNAVTADPDPALARWENEGGLPARRAHPGSDARAMTERGTQISGSITTDAASDRQGARTMKHQHEVRVGRVYDERAPADGSRVLVDRLWPRGLTRSRADVDEWCKQIAPSAALRRWYGHDPTRFVEFRRRYEAELDDPGRAAALRHLRELAQNRTLSLLTATRQVETSEAAVLTDLLNAGPGTV